MATLEDYLFTKNTKWVLWGAFTLVLAALIFHAGVVVGSHSRPMPGRGPGGGFEAQMPFGGGAVSLPQGFIPGGHGALGTIAAIVLPTLTLTSRDGMTLRVEVSSTTVIAGGATGGLSDLVVGDTVIVIGDPHDTDNNGDIDARLVRITSAHAPAPTSQQ